MTPSANDVKSAIEAESGRTDTYLGPNWKSTRRRGKFTPYAVVVHHTASRKGEFPCRRLFEQGRGGGSPLPPPIVQTAVTRSGRIAIFSVGKSVHAGYGKYTFPGVGRVKGNRWWYGIETESNGTGEQITDGALLATVSICVALCRLHGWDASRVIGHYECDPKRKVDPIFGKGVLGGPERMNEIRRMVGVRLAGGAAPIPKREDDDMIPPWMAKAAADEIVTNAYREVCKREPDPGGYEHWRYFLHTAVDQDAKLNNSEMGRTAAAIATMKKGMALQEAIPRGVWTEEECKKRGWI